MSIRDEVTKAIERRGPRFVPLRIYDDPVRSDVIELGVAPAKDFRPADPDLTEWGYRWQRLDRTMGQVKEHPLPSWDGFAEFRRHVPDPRAPGRFDAVAAEIARRPDKYYMGCIGISGFNLLTFLRGFENVLEDLVLHPKPLGELADLVFGFEEEIIRGFAKTGVSAICFYDDWGTERSLMISPELWRRFFGPRYARQFRLVHSLGRHVFFHSCGQVRAIIGDLIELGADMLNFNQANLLGIDWLRERYAGKVCFFCPNDIQTTLPRGTKSEIEAEVRRLIDAFGQPSGGFIAQAERYESMAVPLESFEYSIECFRRYGVY